MLVPREEWLKLPDREISYREHPNFWYNPEVKIETRAIVIWSLHGKWYIDSNIKKKQIDKFDAPTLFCNFLQYLGRSPCL